jgi:hypothetical protein
MTFRDALAASLTHTLAKPAALTELPFVTVASRSARLATYAALAGPKALAVALDGTVVIVPNANDGGLTGAAEAKRIALERCEMQATFAPCTLFAADATVVYEPF